MTFATKLYAKLFGEQVGQDEFGNIYFRSTRILRDFGRENRWVCYNGLPIGGKVPSTWFLWLHYQADLPPNKNDAIHKSHHWEKNHMPNLTGTSFSYSPDKTDKRVKQSYKPWRQEINE
ncbi:MAG: NADH-ubiquinone oxidoreductase subunit NDUFA12 family protein [Candidatus Midichloria sp.]|nr:NADH-ubiquinone oxidoreductase subunit NDUFA12 family protein [Candidatus Midichloria sp.]